MKIYNKLVRDKIPEIINADNRKANAKFIKATKICVKYYTNHKKYVTI